MAFYEVSVAENISAADFLFVASQYNAVVEESISVADVTNCFGFGTIDNSQSTTWTLIDNRQ
jgi:hypothetical protein